MSKISSLRIINLNYNNNTMKIDDEIFDLGGESTLLSLRNGGGKSVMVQMMISPFVTKRYRDTKDREFSSYFTQTSPTYILVEWLLDDEKTNVLIGMMIRKKSSNDEDNEEDIDIINFIHEYSGESKYSLRNIPFIETKQNERRIKNYGNSKSLFEKLKKDTEVKFNYYDMNIYNQSRSYFDTLKQYKINHKEWESIIKEINKKESGLSELFSESKTVSGLVEKWFIKAVEDKLNENETKNKIKSFGEICKKYIYQYKENKHKLNQKEAIEKFKLCSNEILEKAYKLKQDKDNTSAVENKLANLIKYLEDLLHKENENINNLQDKIKDIETYINDLEYEKSSLEIYELQKKVEEVINEENTIKKDIKELEEKINKSTHQKNILECAQVHENYQIASKEVQELENKMLIVKSENKDLQPERENIGFTLKNYYLNKEQKLQNEIQISIDSQNEVNEKIKVLELSINSANDKFAKKNELKGKLEGSMEFFNKEEINFNKKYDKDFARNIIGFYEENFITKEKLSYEENKVNIQKQVEKYKLERINISKDIERNERQEKSLSLENVKCDNRLSILSKELENINTNISKRKDILKYIDSSEEYLLEDDYIKENLEKKLYLLNEDLKNLNIKIQNQEEEINKLISGKMIELSKDIQSKFDKKDIHITYGMEWLKKNNYSEKENINLVKNNPLIPYSIIINREDIEKLQKESLNIFTSYPIPLIEKESLENAIGESKNEIYILNNSRFLLSFNKNLLNEKQLKTIIIDLESKKNKYIESKNYKSKEIEKYNELLYYIKHNPLSKISYDNVVKEIKLNKEKIKSLEIEIKETNENIKKLNLNKNNISDSINKSENKFLYLQKEIEDFNEFCVKYEQYKNNKEQLQDTKEEIKDIYDYLENKKSENKYLNTKLHELKEESLKMNNEHSNTKENCIKYKNFNTGEIIAKDIEDLEARYESLTQKISSSLSDIEKQLEDGNKRYKRAEEQLLQRQNKYNLKDEDFKHVIYNNHSESLLEAQIKKLINTQKNKNELEKDIREEKGNLNSKIEKLYEEIKKLFDKDYPKPKDEVSYKDFENIIFIEKSKIDNLEKSKKISNYNINKIESYVSGLSEFNYLKIENNIDLEFTVEDLKNYISEIKRDYKISKEDEQIKYNLLYKEIDKTIREKEFIENDFFKKSLDVVLKVSENPSEVISNLNQTTKAHELLLEKLSADINFINKEKEKIVEILYDYIYEVHINIGKIDKNSTIKINDKPVKMLNIETSNWDENKELYKLKTKNLLESLTNSCLDKLEKNENIEETISKTITTKNLYNEVVSIGSIDVKLYKIEENRQRIISWEQVCKNSGGEGFLSAFIVLNSLLSFMRKSDIDIFKNYEDSKVLIMDNPFAQTNAEHLLKPLMDIAKKSNTQLICFSGLKGDSIYNRFDNIYVLDLINSKLKNNLSFLKGNHYKGEELVQEIISSRFKIEEVIDQVTLF